LLEYTYADQAGNTGNVVTRTVKVLNPTGDEDGDRYTNKEEIENGSNPEDSTSKPTDTTLPVVTLNGSGIVRMLQNSGYVEL
jgi:hypothetical protein